MLTGFDIHTCLAKAAAASDALVSPNAVLMISSGIALKINPSSNGIGTRTGSSTPGTRRNQFMARSSGVAFL